MTRPRDLYLALLAPFATAALACGDPSIAAPDATPQRNVASPCVAPGADVTPNGAPIASGRYRLTWTPPCTLGAINPLTSDELLDVDVAAGTATFSDADGGCVDCGAVHRGSPSGACLQFPEVTVGSSKQLAAYTLCATASGIVAEQIWSGYPGPPDPVTWRLTGVAE